MDGGAFDARELPAGVAERLSSPALLVDLDRVRANVAAVIRAVGGADRWRPHVKTTKIPEVWAELARAGLASFKCATTREARVLAGVLRSAAVPGADVLVAYPLRPPALDLLGDLARAVPEVRFAVLVEDPELVERVPAEVSIFVDVDPGMHRTGIDAADLGTIRDVARRAGPRFRGVHFYDGHLHDGTLAEREAPAFAAYDRLLGIAAELAEAGALPTELVTSGTPTFLLAARHGGLARGGPWKHRVSPGTCVFHDARSHEQNGGAPGLTPAAVVLARVVSWPGGGRVTCDAGAKAVAAEAGDPCAVPLGHPELVAETPNEEHLPFRVTRGERPARGTPLLLVPRHVCPTVNLAREAVLVEGGEVREVVPVAAGGHDLGWTERGR